jgi:hypothetical protein
MTLKGYTKLGNICKKALLAQSSTFKVYILIDNLKLEEEFNIIKRLQSLDT